MRAPAVRVLVACEFSGIVREAFRHRGHDAWSCDLLPAEDRSPYHLQMDARAPLHASSDGKPWDLLIAHPPCTYLANSGARWLYQGGRGRVKDPARWAAMHAGCDFFAALYHAPIARIAIENPIQHLYARDYLASAWKVPSYTQTIQPYEYGHPETKRTCLWLRGLLPPLQPTCIVQGRTPRVHHASPGPDRWKERSRTLQGIADAMAEQWGDHNY